MAPAQPIKLYRSALSGHAHRVELFLSLLGLPVERIDVDLARGGQRDEAFLKLNPFGQVPVIDDGGTVIADSNAILVYLAKRYGGPGWLPDDPVAAARVQRWLSVAAGEIAHGPALARLARLIGAKVDAAAAIQRSEGLFALMDGLLVGQAYLAGDTPTIADIAGYSYIAHAPEGGVPLAPYGHLCRWLARIEALPGFVPMVNRPERGAA